MEQDIVSVGFDPAFKSEIDAITDSLDTMYASIKKTDGTKISPGDATGWAQLKKQVDALTDAHTKQTAAAKSSTDAITKLDQAKAKLAASESRLTKEAALYNVQASQQATLNRLNATLAAAVPGSLEAAAAKVALYRNELSILNLTTEAGKARQTELIGAIDQQNQFIDKNSDALARQKINIGNYSGALHGLSEGLRGIGALGTVLSHILGVNPEIAAGILEAGRGLREVTIAENAFKDAKKADTAATAAQTTTYKINQDTTETNTAVTELNTVAVEEETVARTGLNAIMWAGIGLASLLVAGIIYMIVSSRDHAALLKEESEASKEYNDRIKSLIDATNEYDSVRRKSAEKEIKDLDDLIERRKALGISTGESLAFDKRSAELKLKFATDEVQANNITSVSVEKKRKAYEDEAKTYAAIQDYNKGEADKMKNVEVDAKRIYPGRSGFQSDYIEKIRSDYKKYADKRREDEADHKSQLEGRKADYERDAELFSKSEEYKQKVSDLTNEASKLAADELRKYNLALAETEVESEQSKNNRILSSDHSTFAQRLQALKDNQLATEKSLKAQNTSVQSDPTISGNDKVISTMKMNEKIDELRKEESAKELKAIEDNNKRILEAQHATEISNIDATAAALQVTTKDITASLDTRLAAYTNYFSKEHEKIIADHDFQSATRELNAAELIALDTDTNNKLKALREKSKQEISDIVVSGLTSELALTESYDKRELASKILTITETIKGKKRQTAAIEALTYQAQVDELQKEIKKDLDITANDKSTKKELLAAEMDFNAKITALDKIKAQKDQEDRDKKKAAEKEVFDYVVQIAEQSLTLIQTLVDAGYDRQHNALQKLIDDNTSYGQAETERISNSTLNEQDKAAATIQVNDGIATQNKILAAEQREADIKKARFDKESGITRILIETAVAEIKALSYLADPITAPFYPAIAALIGTLGAVELAVAIATPIPTYADGGWHPKTGPAIYGEAGLEKVQEPGKAPYYVDQATYGILPAGTRLTPVAINDAMHQSEVMSMADRVALTDAIEGRRAETQWKIARYLAGELKPQGQRRQRAPIVKIDLGMTGYINQQIFGK